MVNGEGKAEVKVPVKVMTVSRWDEGEVDGIVEKIGTCGDMDLMKTEGE